MSLEQLEDAPDLQDIALMLDTAVRGDGLVINLPPLVREYQTELQEVIDIVRKGGSFPEGFKFFIPDLWKISMASTRQLPKGDGKRLWNAQIYGHKVAMEYLDRDYSTVLPDKYGYPGTNYKPK